MTLAVRLIILVAGVLLLSLVAGGVVIAVGAVRWVQAEIDTTAAVAHALVEQRLAEAAEETESPERLSELLRSLETGYHLHASFRASGGTLPEAAPASPPSVLSRLLGVHPTVEEIPVALPGLPAGRVVLAIDPEPEVARVWRAIEISLAAITLVSTTTLVLVAIGLSRSLRPLGQLADALSRVGTGDYSPRVAAGGPREIALLGRQFNLMTDQLRHMRMRTRALDAQMAAVQEQERREIGHDLHDELGPCLLAANLDVAALQRMNRAGDRRGIEDCAGGLAALLERMQSLVRRMIGRLHLEADETPDLAAAIDELVAFWRDRCPEIEWRTALPPGDGALGEGASAMLLRIAREAVTNAVRHSGARRITIRADAAGGGLALEIADDGIGMAADAREGVGIGGMRARVGALGGTLAIASRPGHGTTVTARLPCPAALLGSATPERPAVPA